MPAEWIDPNQALTARARGVLAAKVVWEQFAGTSSATEAALGGPIAVPSHLYGGLAGLMTGLLLRSGATLEEGA